MTIGDNTIAGASAGTSSPIARPAGRADASVLGIATKYGAGFGTPSIAKEPRIQPTGTTGAANDGRSTFSRVLRARREPPRGPRHDPAALRCR